MLAMLVALLVVSISPGAYGQTWLDDRTSLAFESVSPSTVFEFIARARSFEAVVDPRLSKKVSLRLDNVRFRVALDALCDSIGCRWRVEGQKLIVSPATEVERAEPGSATGEGRTEDSITLLRRVVPPGTRFDRVKTSSVLEALARVAGPEVVLTVRELDPNRVVSLDVGGLTVLAAIRRLMSAAEVRPGTMYQVKFTGPGGQEQMIVGMLPKDPN